MVRIALMACSIVTLNNSLLAQTPFTCSNSAYLMKGPTTSVSLYHFDLLTGVTGSLIYDPGALANCLAYNPIDNMLYMLVTRIPSGGNLATARAELVRIDATGTATTMPVTNLATALGINPTNGAITPDGYYIANTASGGSAYVVIDLNPARPATYLQIVDPANSYAVMTASPYNKTATAAIGMADWVYNPADGLLYGVTTAGNIATLNIVTGVYTAGSLITLYDGTSPGATKGAVFMDATGKLYMTSNNEVSYSVNLSTAKAIQLSAGTPNTNFDGASCPSAILAYGIMGNVFNDINGISDNLVNGTGTNGGATLYATLYDNTTGQVVASVPVAANGAYAFGATPGRNYSVYIGTTQATVGATTVPATTLPAGYVNTGEQNCGNTAGCTGNDGTPDGILPLGVISGDITHANFGIQRTPNSDDKNHTLTTQPVRGSSLPLNGGSNPPLFSGSDIGEDGTYTGGSGSGSNPQGVRITSLPTNGNELYYNGVLVTAADLNTTLFTDPSLFSLKLTGTNSTSTSFNYAYVDGAGIQDPTPATYTVTWLWPLPVVLTSFNVVNTGNEALLHWVTSSEQNNKGFVIERSADARSWTRIGFQNSLGNGGNSSEKIDYTFIDHAPKDGRNYYRLLQTDFDGRQTISSVQMITIAEDATVTVFPNPTQHSITIKGLNGQETLKLIDVTGRVVLQGKATANQATLNLSMLNEGLYQLYIQSNNKLEIKKVVKHKN